MSGRNGASCWPKPVRAKRSSCGGPLDHWAGDSETSLFRKNQAQRGYLLRQDLWRVRAWRGQQSWDRWLQTLRMIKSVKLIWCRLRRMVSKMTRFLVFFFTIFFLDSFLQSGSLNTNQKGNHRTTEQSLVCQWGCPWCLEEDWWGDVFLFPSFGFTT